MWRSWGVVLGLKGRDEKGYACWELDWKTNIRTAQWSRSYTWTLWVGPRLASALGEQQLSRGYLSSYEHFESQSYGPFRGAITELVSALVDRLSLRDLQLFILSLIVSHLPAMIGPHTS